MPQPYLDVSNNILQAVWSAAARETSKPALPTLRNEANVELVGAAYHGVAVQPHWRSKSEWEEEEVVPQVWRRVVLKYKAYSCRLDHGHLLN